MRRGGGILVQHFMELGVGDVGCGGTDDRHQVVARLLGCAEGSLEMDYLNDR